jgi:hypothetical protein
LAKSLLLISEKPEDQAFAVEVAKATGLSYQTARDPKHGVEIILQESPVVILVDATTGAQYQAFENAIQESIGLFSDRINANAIHFISSDDLEKAPYLVQSPLFGHFLTRTYGDPAEAGAYYGRIVRQTFKPRAFGLQELLAAGTKIQVVKLQLSTQKLDAVEAVRNFAIAAKFQARMATTIANAVDEILMNAIFDAPIDELGRPLYKVTSRSSQLKLEGRNAVEMHIGFDGKYIGIAAVDNFGSLDKNSLLSHVSKIYTEEEYKVKASVASAGIGLATVYRSGGSLFFTSESRVKTEVTVMFKRTENFREFKDQFRYLSTQFYF